MPRKLDPFMDGSYIQKKSKSFLHCTGGREDLNSTARLHIRNMLRDEAIHNLKMVIKHCNERIAFLKTH